MWLNEPVTNGFYKLVWDKQLRAMRQNSNVIIECDTDGWLVADVPTLRGCHTQAKSFDELDVDPWGHFPLSRRCGFFRMMHDGELSKCISDGRRTTIPVHGKESPGAGILLKILRDVEMTRDDLLGLL